MSVTTTSGAPTVLASGLAVPWGVAFLPDGSALVSERDTHELLGVRADGKVTRLGTVPDVADNSGEGGLLGLAVSPGFAQDKLVYAYLTATSDNRVVRFALTGTGIGPATVVLSGIPKAGNHDGGRIQFGPDGLLYVTTGDATQRGRAQDRSYLGGKVLRMTADGKPAPGASDLVFTLGHRNPQGLAWTPDGTLFEAEFGQNSMDEINRLTAGANYGWPDAEGSGGSHAPRFTAPLLTFGTEVASPSGLAYAGGSLWLAALQGKRLYRIPVLADGRLGPPAMLLDDQFGRLRTVVRAPDGALWVTTSNRDGRGDPTAADDRIVRIALTA